MEKLLMADLLPNGLLEKVRSICYITKSRLDVQFVKKNPLGNVPQMKEKGYNQN